MLDVPQSILYWLEYTQLFELLCLYARYHSLFEKLIELFKTVEIY